MNSPNVDEQVLHWLTRKIWWWVGGRILASVGILLLGTAVIFATFWISYCVLWMILRGFDMGPDVLWWSACAFVVLLFLGNATTDRAYLEEYSVTTGTHSDKVVTFLLPGVGMVSNINPLAPDTLHTGVKMITSFLYIGPRLVTAGLRVCVQACRFALLDRAGCASVIAFLFKRRERATFAEIVDGVPEIDPARIFPHIGLIDGVLVIRAKPVGLALSTRLTDELTKRSA